MVRVEHVVVTDHEAVYVNGFYYESSNSLNWPWLLDRIFHTFHEINEFRSHNWEGTNFDEYVGNSGDWPKTMDQCIEVLTK